MGSAQAISVSGNHLKPAISRLEATLLKRILRILRNSWAEVAFEYGPSPIRDGSSLISRSCQPLPTGVPGVLPPGGGPPPPPGLSPPPPPDLCPDFLLSRSLSLGS